jgi:hypothetical protein
MQVLGMRNGKNEPPPQRTYAERAERKVFGNGGRSGPQTLGKGEEVVVTRSSTQHHHSIYYKSGRRTPI